MPDQPSRPKLQHRLVKWTMTALGTGLVAILAGTAVWQSSTALADRAAAVEKPARVDAPSVTSARLVVQPGYKIIRTFAGQIEAPRTAQLSFEQGGTLADILVDDGDRVEPGQLLARLDDRLLQADLNRLIASQNALRAQLELAQLTDARQAALQKRGFASTQNADQARLTVSELTARLAEMDASILAAQIRLEKSELRAPFQGVVNRQLIDAGNTVGAGQAVVTMVENDQAIFKVGIDPDLTDRLSLGDMLEISFGSEARNADVIAILPQIDAATRTRTVRARLRNTDPVTFGQTGEISLTQTINDQGAWVPLSALEDGVRGLWTIKTLTSSDQTYHTVSVEAVEIIYANSQHAFVRGTFEDNTPYIDQGVHRVVTGQTVRVGE